MTSKERVICAMNLEKPDRVPLMCQFSIGSMMQQLQPDPVKFWYDKNVFADGLVTLCRKFRFDGILVSLHGHSPDWDKSILKLERTDEGSVKLYYPDRTEIHSRDDLPFVTFLSDKTFPDVEALDPLRDIPEEIDYIPVSNNLHFKLDRDHLFDIFGIIYDKVGEEFSIHGEITSPFDYFLDLLGHENGLIAMLLAPEKCKTILKRFTGGVLDIALKMCDQPIDAIKVSSPFAGMGFISSELYREFVLPYEQKINMAVRGKGKHIYTHTCGAITDRLELMSESFASGLECLDPPPIGNVDIEDAFLRIGKDMFIKGNIDSVNSLLYAGDEKAENDVRKIIQTGMNLGKGFILSTACSIAPRVTEERLMMLAALIEKYGVYEKNNE